jgi:hypothetical protein
MWNRSPVWSLAPVAMFRSFTVHIIGLTPSGNAYCHTGSLGASIPANTDSGARGTSMIHATSAGG